MAKLLAVISPAKLLDDKTHYPNIPCSQPDFSEEAKKIIGILKKKSAKDLAELMNMSAALAEETALKVQRWHLPFTHENAHPAMLMFKGEVYRGLQAEQLNLKQLQFAQEHMRILSGLYGILRPLDLIMPYRLMMGTPITIDKNARNLYAYWTESVTNHLKEAIDPKGFLIDLASQEYLKCINLKALERKMISCEFRERKGDKLVVVNTYAKSARGKMARFIIENNIKKPTDLKAFNTDGYALLSSASNEENLLFVR